MSEPEGRGGRRTTSLARRHRVDRFMVGAMVVAVVVAIVPLAFILADVIAKGIGQLSWSFLNRANRECNRR